MLSSGQRRSDTPAGLRSARVLGLSLKRLSYWRGGEGQGKGPGTDHLGPFPRKVQRQSALLGNDRSSDGHFCHIYCGLLDATGVALDALSVAIESSLDICVTECASHGGNFAAYPPRLSY